MKYRVLDGLDLDNRAYAAGDTVTIDDDAIVEALLEDGVIAGEVAAEAGDNDVTDPDQDKDGGKAALEEDGKAALEEDGKAALDNGAVDDLGDGDAETDRAARLIAAIGDLATEGRQENLPYWTTSGKPKTEALAAVSGIEDVSAAERDAAWEAHLAGKQGQTSGGT